MKKKLLILFGCTAVTLMAFGYGGLIKVVTSIVTNSSTTVPVRLATNAMASSFTVIGNKDFQTANTGDVFIGVSSTNGQQVFKITTGQVVTFRMPTGEWTDLHDWYLDVATTGDGVILIYSP